MRLTTLLLAGPILGVPMLANDNAGAAPPAAATCKAVPADATLVIGVDEGVALARSSGQELVASVQSSPRKAVRGPDGTVWAEVVSEDQIAEIYRNPVDGEATMSASGEVDAVVLQSVGWLDGRTAAVIVEAHAERPDEPDYRGAILVEYTDGEQVDVGPAVGPEYGAASVTIGAGRLSEGSVVDLAESFSYYDVDVERFTDWFDPTENAAYNAPPFYQWPVAANVGADSADVMLSWVEGPDWDGATNEVVGGWELVVAVAVTGTESLRLDLGDAGERLVHADFDGRFWVGTFGSLLDEGANDVTEVAERVLVLDTQADSPTVVDAGCQQGVIATLDRFGSAAPPPTTVPTTTTAPTTTAAPTTTEVTCEGYVTAPNAYPIRRCHKGALVTVIQQQLVARDYDIEVDGFFGPLTAHAVRQFQRDNNLAVDELVGPDTWLALYTGDPPAQDHDGNGTIDPWDVARGDGERCEGTRPYIGLVFEVTLEGLIVCPDGTPVDGLTLMGGAGLLSDIDATPFYSADYVTGDGDMLWLTRMPGWREDGTPLPGTVVDAVDVPDLAANHEVLLGECFLDGSYDPLIGAVIDLSGVPSGDQAPALHAWRLYPSTERITSVEAARVTCLPIHG